MDICLRFFLLLLHFKECILKDIIGNRYYAWMGDKQA
jgi:hypothetical protein